MQYVCDAFRRWVAFFVARAALWRPASSVRVAGAALQTCRFACFLRIAMSGLCEVVATCKFRGRRDILWDGMRSDGSLARNIDFEIVKFRFLRKLVGKRRFWSYKVWNFEDVSHEMLVLMLLHVSSRVSGFPVASNVSIVEAAKSFLLEGVKASCNFVFVAGVTLPDILMSLETYRDSFCVAGTVLLHRFQKLSCIFRGRRSPLETSIVILRGRRSTWDVSRCVFFGEYQCQGCAMWWQCANLWQAWHVVTCDDTPHSTLYALYSTPYTLHITLCILHSTRHLTLYTPHSRLHTLHPTLRTLHFTLHTLNFTLPT